MLVLRRTEGQWVEVTHEGSGDVLRIKVYDLRGTIPAKPGQAHLAFDDEARNFTIARPERSPRVPTLPDAS